MFECCPHVLENWSNICYEYCTYQICATLAVLSILDIQNHGKLKKGNLQFKWFEGTEMTELATYIIIQPQEEKGFIDNETCHSECNEDLDDDNDSDNDVDDDDDIDNVDSDDEDNGDDDDI
ncbi:hypothetical protein JTB14_032028 [Gonioctena quinquepunctata]|nr:hypothetical protein JTB14_032028 [Gonioctena quinquepunctata]